MAQSNISHRRTHNLLLISKILSLQNNASPLTLVLDSLEQPAKPLLQECIRRANLCKTHTILVSFETLRQPRGIDTFIPAWQFSSSEIPSALTKHVKAAVASTSAKRCVIIIDTLHPLTTITAPTFSLPLFLTSFIISTSVPPQPNTTTVPPKPGPQISILAVHHTDIPPHPSASPYTPSPLTLITYTATTILTLHSLPNLLTTHLHTLRSLPTPTFGLTEELPGTLFSLPYHKRDPLLGGGSSSGGGSRNSERRLPPIPPHQNGLVIELEHRRKSGRSVHENYFLPFNNTSPPQTKSQSHQSQPQQPKQQKWSPHSQREHISLLDDHPLLLSLFPTSDPTASRDPTLSDLTFDLSLTERQRKDREGVVLPYFDAQKLGSGIGAGGDGEGVGEGGRILYDMGSEDDFDEEEDEI